jgi:predicted metallopeptidase
VPRSTKSNKVNWKKAPDVQKRINKLISSLKLTWIDVSNIYAFRSSSSKSKAYARIWGLNRVWQKALNQNPAYIIEVLSEKYDRLSEAKKDEILIHELCHIPKNFSGSLLPHIRKRGKRNFEDRVKTLIAKYKKIR